MPTTASKPWNPTDIDPYVAPTTEIPSSAYPSGSAQPEQTKALPQRPEPNPPSTKGAGIAYVADQALRGLGRAQYAQKLKQQEGIKKLADGLQFSYNMAAQHYADTVQKIGKTPQQLQQEKAELRKSPVVTSHDPTGKVVASPESQQKLDRIKEIDGQLQSIQQARSAVDSVWAANMRLYGKQLGLVGDDGKPAKQKGKGKGSSGGGDQPENPAALITSSDPQDKARGWFMAASKLGPPIYHQVDASIGSAENQAGKRYRTAESETQATTAEAQQEYQHLQMKDPATLTPQDKARKDQLQAMLANPVAAGGKSYAGRFDPEDIKGSSVPQGALGLDGKPIQVDRNDPNKFYRFEDTGQGPRWFEVAPKQQLKTTKDPVTGLPIQSNYLPPAGTLDVGHPVGEVPVKGEVKTITSYDPKTHTTSTHLVPVIPPFQRGHGIVGREGGGGGDVSTVSPTSTSTSGAGTAPGGATRPALSNRQQKSARNELKKTISSTGTSLPTGFIKFNQKDQDKYLAVLGMELTLNGKPGSKDDVGLKKATIDAMQDPATASKVAVAMKALDTYAKGSLSSHDEGDFGWSKYARTELSSVPAISEAFQALDDDPRGKRYLDNFFRAWTNASVIRSFMGSTGKPSQSMYAMLSLELPMIGVNISTPHDAETKLTMLQDDVANVRQNLPDYLKEQVEQQYGGQKSSEISATSSQADPAKVKSLIDRYSITPTPAPVK